MVRTTTGHVRPRRAVLWIGGWLVALALLGARPGGASQDDRALLIFAAASMTDAVGAIARAYEADAGVIVRTSFASSAVLARQIEAGAPAHLFVSANRLWHDHLNARSLLADGGSRAIARNRLMLVAPSRSPAITIDWAQPTTLLDGLADGWLALGQPDSVPAGLYARQAFERLGLWRRLAPRVAAAANVRTALLLVETGEARMGVVYATDARRSRRVRVLSPVPQRLHDPIVYPAAVVATQDGPAARRLFDFLIGPRARAILVEHGFQTPEQVPF